MAVLLALVVALGLTACGSSSDADSDGPDGTGPSSTDPPRPCPVDALAPTEGTVPNVAITAWAPFTGDAMVAFQQLVSSYNASGHGVTVTAQPIPTDPIGQRAL